MDSIIDQIKDHKEMKYEDISDKILGVLAKLKTNKDVFAYCYDNEIISHQHILRYLCKKSDDIARNFIDDCVNSIKDSPVTFQLFATRKTVDTTYIDIKFLGIVLIFYNMKDSFDVIYNSKIAKETKNKLLILYECIHRLTFWQSYSMIVDYYLPKLATLIQKKEGQNYTIKIHPILYKLPKENIIIINDGEPMIKIVVAGMNRGEIKHNILDVLNANNYYWDPIMTEIEFRGLYYNVSGYNKKIFMRIYAYENAIPYIDQGKFRVSTPLLTANYMLLESIFFGANIDNTINYINSIDYNEEIFKKNLTIGKITNPYKTYQMEAFRKISYGEKGYKWQYKKTINKIEEKSIEKI